MRYSGVVSLFLVCHCLVYANEIRAISLDEFNETILPAIGKAEKLIQNFEIEFEMSEKQKPLNSTSEDWKDSGSYSKVSLLSDGQKTEKFKLEVFVEKHGTKVINEKSYSLCYNVNQGKRLLHGKSSKGKTFEIKECIILPNRSDTIKSETSSSFYEKPFILNFLGWGTDLSFSNYIKQFMSPKTKSPTNLSRNIKLVKFVGVDCVRIEIELTGVLRDTYWLAPDKNYAPMAVERVHWDKSGKEVVTSFKKVMKFKKLTGGIWFPVITQIEARGIRMKIRKTQAVSEIKININDLKDVDFDLNIPSDYKIIDKRVKKED